MEAESATSNRRVYDEVSLSDHDAVRKEKFNIMKNILLICLSFLLNFTAFAGISNLQSSLNPDEGLGTGSLSIIYGSLIVSAMFTPTFIIRHIGCKWTIFGSILGYTCYSLANFYPSWGTLVPASIILGFSGAPLWSAKCTYLTTVAKRYARLTNESVDAVVNRFFGIFFLIFQMNQIIGNLISSFVLSSANTASLEFPDSVSEEEKVRIENFCGANDCQNGTGRADSTKDEIPDETIYILMGIYTAVGLLAAANMAFFVDRIVIRDNESRGTKELLSATFLHMKDRRQIMLIIITMYSGFEQAFITGDYTQSFITCPIAVNWIGFIMICFGGVNSICSFLFGRIEKYTGRIPLFSLSTLINLGIIITLLVWVPYPTSPAPFFVIPAFWGMADAVWQTQLNALYGVLFFNRQEESFANYRLWESIGFVIAFAYQSFICVYIKLYVLLSFLIVGMSLYLAVEFLEKRRDKNPTAADISNGQTGQKSSLGDSHGIQNGAYRTNPSVGELTSF
ncbi:protein unc-93 homolog A-like [Styela clava]